MTLRRTIDFYLLRQIVGYLVAMTIITLLALLLERMLRLLEITQNSDQVVGYLSQMLLNLIPHYLGIALPAAFFLAVFLTFSRLNRDNELAALQAAGIGLPRMIAPILFLGTVLLLVAAATFSYFQPYGRYTYRSLVHTIANASLSAAVREGTFIQHEGRTFLVEGATADGSELRKVFIYERQNDGGIYVTTANTGSLRESQDGKRTFLFLDSGSRAEISGAGEGEGVLSFQDFSWPLRDNSAITFRDRGHDERELTIPELMIALRGPPDEEVSKAEFAAELNSRMVRMLSLFFLPFLAVPLALGGGRVGQTYGIVLGVVILVVYVEVLQFGDSLVQIEKVTPLAGLWLPFAVFVSLSLLLFYRAAFRVTEDPLGGLGTWVQSQFEKRNRTQQAGS